MTAKKISYELAREAVDTVTRAKGNVTRAARELGVSRTTLQGRIDSAKINHGLDVGVEPIVDEKVELRDKIRILETQISSHRRETLDDKYVKEKILGIKEEYDKLDPPYWLATPVKAKSITSIPTLVLSDLHWGETVNLSQVEGVNEYNIQIANKRLKTIINKAVTLVRNHISGMEYPGFVLCLGGDMLAGDIHEELTETNEIPVFPAMLDLMSALISAITMLANEFGQVYIPCVAGNHGRTTRKPRAKMRNETNLDWLLYQFLKLHFQHDMRVFIDSPTSPEVTFKVFNHTYRLCHGDQLGKGGDGIIGFLGPVVRGDHKKRSLASQLHKPYNTLIHGHYHTYAATQRFISNGSLVGYDEYAMSNGFGFEIPQQAFWLTHAVHGITFSMPVHAEDPAPVKNVPWVSFERRAA